MSLHEHWEQHAHAWAAWARTPGHDSYEAVRDGFFELVVPPAREATLELGCGEGRVCRDLRDRGHNVTGVDRSPTLLALAREADPQSVYVEADAASLPFDDASFDLVMTYNALMNFDDLDAALVECARVLRANGHFVACVVHPIAYALKREGDAFVMRGSYYDSGRLEGTYSRDGLTMTFVDYRRTIEDYVDALVRAGFLVERLCEVSDDDGARRPQFMFLRCVKRTGAN